MAIVERKKRRKVYFTIGGLGLKPGLDPCTKVGSGKFTKRTRGLKTKVSKKESI